jgi:hypothetical protein
MLSERVKKALAAYLLLKRRNRRRYHRWWVHPINESREMFGEFHKLCEKLKNFPECYFKYFLMTQAQFETLHSLVQDKIRKEDTKKKKGEAFQRENV